MGNNNATAILTEEESLKLETNGMSPLGAVSTDTTQDQMFLSGEDKEKESSKLETNGMSPLNYVSVETTQGQVFLGDEVKDGDKKKESTKLETNEMSSLDSVSKESTQDQVFLLGEGKDGDKEKDSVEITQDQFFLAGVGKTGDVEIGSLVDGVTETKPQSKELAHEPKVESFEEEMDPNGLKSLVMETNDHLQRQISVVEGVQIVCEAREVEELSIIGTQSDVSKLNSTESSNKENLCAVVFVSPSLFETVGIEEKVVNESPEEVVFSSEEVVMPDQETGMEQRTGREVFLETEEVTNVGKADKAISTSKPSSQESNAIQETGLKVNKEEPNKREAIVKRISRCRSLPVSQKSIVIGDSLVQELVSEFVFPSRNKKGSEKAKTSESLIVSCIGSNKAQETVEAITENNLYNIEARHEMRSPSFGNDLRAEERSDESIEKTPLLCEDKNEIYEATIDVEEKTVMLKRCESLKTRGIERSLELKKNSDSFKGAKDLEGNLLDKTASSGSMKGIVRKRSKSSLLGTCLCCTTAI